MIERKRRNDFVRKREFDMLRKVRREGLSGEQLAALGGSSRIDDSEPRIADSRRRQDAGVKAKIDEIEQQMVGDGYCEHAAPRARVLQRADRSRRRSTSPRRVRQRARAARRARRGASAVARRPGRGLRRRRRRPPPRRRRPRRRRRSRRLGWRRSTSRCRWPSDFGKAVRRRQITEVAHDPELDEAVIAFANADFEQCEQALPALTGLGGTRAQHAETWLVLFDLYRATGQQHKFESLALDYAQQFGWSAPQWFSMPKLVAEAASDERPRSARIDGQVGWVCPQLPRRRRASPSCASLALQMPLPWVFDWGALQTHRRRGRAAGCRELFRSWMPQDLDMRWLGGERLFTVLQEAAPTGVRDADPAFWQLRLDALRMANRPDQFDEAAIDYCVTYEVSPPSWEAGALRGPHQRLEPEHDAAAAVGGERRLDQLHGIAARPTTPRHGRRSARVELSGQLVGDIGADAEEDGRRARHARRSSTSPARA